MIHGSGSGEGSSGYIGEYHPLNKNLATCDRPPHFETNIYFIQAHPDGLIKIGLAQNPYRRLSTLQVGSPVPLVLRAFQHGDSHSELGLHVQFARDHSHGEWFHPTPRLLKYMKRVGLPSPLHEARHEEPDIAPPASIVERKPLRELATSFAEFRKDKYRRPKPITPLYVSEALPLGYMAGGGG